MTTAPNWGSTAHHPPGTDRAESQHKHIASGYPMAETPDPVKRSQPKTTTGHVKVPGWNRG